MMIKRLHHAQITIPVGAEAVARRFYGDLLGLREIPKPEALQGRGGLWLALGEQQLHIGVEDGVVRQATKAHLAYEVDDVAAWRQKLEAYGCHIKESVPLPGHERFETLDPFDNRIEFISPLPP